MLLGHYGEEVVKGRASQLTRRSGVFSFAFFALATLLSALAAYGAPAMGATNHAARSITAAHDGETVALREARGGEIVSLRRAPKADASGADRPAAFVGTASPLQGIAPLVALNAFDRTHVPWRTAARSRALSMVFLN